MDMKNNIKVYKVFPTKHFFYYRAVYTPPTRHSTTPRLANTDITFGKHEIKKRELEGILLFWISCTND